MIISLLLFILNDAIVVWRAWTVTQRVLRGVLAILLGTTIGNPLLTYQVLHLMCLCQVCVVVDVAILYRMQLSSTVPTQAPVGPPLLGPPGLVFNLIIYGPLIVTNLVSTLIIFHKTWFVLYPAQGI